MRTRLIKLSLRLCACLPLRAVHVLGAVAGWLLARVPNDSRHVAGINLARCFPGLNAADRQHLMEECLIETAKTAVETGPLWYWDRERIRRLVLSAAGEDLLEQSLATGRGAILAIPHLGAWEVVGLYCSMRYPMTSLYRPPRLGSLDALMTTARERFGARLVPSDTAGVRALLKALRRGELLAILPDQEPRYGNGIFSPFFGIPAYTMTLLARLAQQTGAPVFITYAVRLPRGSGYRLHFHPLALPPDDASVEGITAAVNIAIEDCVRQIPQQYQWSYKRFKTRPPGEPRFYPRRTS
ncbi:MAG: lysophospholipid acyltransferase family protein [Gammaproteobacteria bacterium]|nr:lysophospholipid acyltransferase family protein [Gammaproteobacteria bacterium]